MTCLFPVLLKDKEIVVPCGKCFSCRRNQGSDWQLRLTHEANQYKHCVHLTLTYDNRYYHNSDSEAKRDLQLFIKGVRNSYRNTSKKIRFFSVCERGPRTGRLHHHCLIFNASTYDAQRNFKNKWQKGFIYCKALHVKNMTSYVTNYVGTKECVWKTMSKGIGKGYLTPEMVNYHRAHDATFVVLPHTNGVKRRMPRYYVQKIWPTLEERVALNRRKEIEDPDWQVNYTKLMFAIYLADYTERVIENQRRKDMFYYRKNRYL